MPQPKYDKVVVVVVVVVVVAVQLVVVVVVSELPHHASRKQMFHAPHGSHPWLRSDLVLHWSQSALEIGTLGAQE